MKQSCFTEGKIQGPLLKFTVPVLFALFLQSLYGAADLMICGQFASSADVSAVSTGSQIMSTLTNVVAGFSMAVTVLLGQAIGRKEEEEAGRLMGTVILLFAIIAAVLAVLVMVFAGSLASLMNAPQEAYTQTVSYVRICGAGMIFIIAYNLIGSIFRGLGNSKMPLISVAIACVLNILGDIVLVSGFQMGAAGAAIATVAAQLISVILSLLIIRKVHLPFAFRRDQIRLDIEKVKRIIFLGIPIALQDLLVSISFLVILSIVNSLGLVASAGVGVAEKVCGFIMLVPSAFSQSMSAFVAQNIGAGKPDRAVKSLRCGIAASFAAGVCMFYLAYFHGTLLAEIFSKDPEVVSAAADYLRSYGIDCLLTAVFFCFVGFYNGMGKTRFVMIQGIVGAFLVRIPVSWYMSRLRPVSLFKIGLATPCSSIVQLIFCLVYMIFVKKELKKMELSPSHSEVL